MNEVLGRVKHQLWMRLGLYPRALVLFRLYGLMANSGVRVVAPDVDIVIEGYPRSANTYALAAFTVAQPRPVTVAHHLHAPAQLIWAGRHGVPALLLVRPPKAAITSLLVRQPYVSVRQALENYVRFHDRLLPYSNGYLVATFDQLTRDFGAVIERVNERFGTAFERFVPTDQNVRECNKMIDEMDRQDRQRQAVTQTTVARPSKERSRLKQLKRQNLDWGEFEGLVLKADSLYQTYLELEGQC